MYIITTANAKNDQKPNTESAAKDDKFIHKYTGFSLKLARAYIISGRVDGLLCQFQRYYTLFTLQVA